MSSLEDELQNLREKNSNLVKEVQYWKKTAAQIGNEKLELLKETNELRLKLGSLRSGGAAQARKLDEAIQSASKQALSYLVDASGEVARTMQLIKDYMNEREEVEAALPRWSSMSNTPNADKIHRVPPMMIGGQSIQPVVSLSRTMVDLNSLRTNRSSNSSANNSFQRAVPMHELQDLYIPLTRIDLPQNNMETEDEDEEDNIADNNELDDSTGQELQESGNVSDSEGFDVSQRLDVIEEDMEPEDEVQQTPRARPENPLEGPSWMLDGHNKARKTKNKMTLEPDSTTECDSAEQNVIAGPSRNGVIANDECVRPSLSTTLACAFSPTVRRRKRIASPPLLASPFSPLTASPRPKWNSNNGRILKVIVSKLRLDDSDVTPPKRPTIDQQMSPRRLSTTSPILPPPRNNSTVTKQSKNNLSLRDDLSLSDNLSLKDLSLRDNPSSSQARDVSPIVQLSRDRRLSSFDAPSPNGATTSHLIVSETIVPPTFGGDVGGSGEPMVVLQKISKREKRTSRDNIQTTDNRTTSHENLTTRHENRTTSHENLTTRHENRTTSNENRTTSHDNRTTSHDNQATSHNNSTSSHNNNSSRENRHEKRSRRKSQDVGNSRFDSMGSGDKYDSRGFHNVPDSDSSSGGELATEGRTRRPRKAVTYKEKPLNRKMRR